MGSNDYATQVLKGTGWSYLVDETDIAFQDELMLSYGSSVERFLPDLSRVEKEQNQTISHIETSVTFSSHSSNLDPQPIIVIDDDDVICLDSDEEDCVFDETFGKNGKEFVDNTFLTPVVDRNYHREPHNPHDPLKFKASEPSFSNDYPLHPLKFNESLNESPRIPFRQRFIPIPTDDVLSFPKSTVTLESKNALTAVNVDISTSLSGSVVKANDEKAKSTDDFNESDNLRNNIKLQISLLRSRKRNGLLFNDSENFTTNLDYCRKCSPLNNKKKLTNTIMTTSVSIISRENISTHDINLKEGNALSKESKLQIDEQEVQDNRKVFDQIREIINKRKHRTENQMDTKMDIFSSFSASFAIKNVQDKSPFLSATLEDFLSAHDCYPTITDESSKYQVEDPSLILKNVNRTPETPKKPNTPKIVKAKTVAERRKKLERAKKRELKKLEGKSSNRTNLNKFGRVNKLENENRSYVLFNNKKLYVTSRIFNQCFVNIDSSIPKIRRKRKWYLLSQKPNPHLSKEELKRPKIFSSNYKTINDTVSNVIEDLIRYVELKEIAPTLIKEDDATKAAKSPKKRTKVELELLKLTCTLVNAEVNPFCGDACTKPYCELGCVCKSLSCEQGSPSHCQKVSCMFGCVCAKSIPPIFKENFLNNWTVSLENLDLSQILPYCLLHNVYNCHCFSKPEPILPSCSTGNELPEQNNVHPKETIADKISQPSDIGSIPNWVPEDLYTTYTNKTSIKNSRKDTNKFLKNDFIVLKELKKSEEGEQNKTEKGEIIVDEQDSPSCSKSKKLSQQNNIYRKESKTSQSCLQPSDIEKLPSWIPEDLMKPSLKKPRKHPKDSLKNDFTVSKSKSLKHDTIRQTVEEINTAEECAQNKTEKDEATIRKQTNKTVPVFADEIIVDEQDLKLLEGTGILTGSQKYVRLFPWTSLINSFDKSEINIWCTNDYSPKILINKFNKKCPKNYINIKESNHKKGIIEWILKNELPSCYQSDFLHFMLRETKDNHEIYGICLKNNTDKYQNVTSPKLNSDRFYHKDLNGVNQTLCRTKEQNLPETHLVPVESGIFEFQNKCIMARLPNSNTPCGWFVVFLNSDFSYLLLKRAQYTIKHEDLRSTSEIAKKNKCTVSLKNVHLQEGNKGSGQFGLYFDEMYEDLVFVGPYFGEKFMDVDIETLRYINGTLISNQIYGIMTGSRNIKSGFWLAPCTKEDSPNLECLTNADVLINSLIKPSIGHSEIITWKNYDVRIIGGVPETSIHFNRYIITNIPHLGYLGAFRYRTEEIDVSWTFENKIFRFRNENEATSFLQKRFSSVLQRVPESFMLTVFVAINIDLNFYKPVDPGLLDGQYICGEFGCYDISTLNDNECHQKVGVSKEEIKTLFKNHKKIMFNEEIEYLVGVLGMPNREYDLTRILKKTEKEILVQEIKLLNNIKLKKSEAETKQANILILQKVLASQQPPLQRIVKKRKCEVNIHKNSTEMDSSNKHLNKENCENLALQNVPSMTVSNIHHSNAVSTLVSEKMFNVSKDSSRQKLKEKNLNKLSDEVSFPKLRKFSTKINTWLTAASAAKPRLESSNSAKDKPNNEEIIILDNDEDEDEDCGVPASIKSLPMLKSSCGNILNIDLDESGETSASINNLIGKEIENILQNHQKSKSNRKVYTKKDGDAKSVPINYIPSKEVIKYNFGKENVEEVPIPQKLVGEIICLDCSDEEVSV